MRASGNEAVRFNIETKIDPTVPGDTVDPEAFATALIAAIREAGMESRSSIQSFDWRTLVLVRRLAPEIAIVALTDQQSGEDTVEAGLPGATAWLGGYDVDRGRRRARRLPSPGPAAARASARSARRCTSRRSSARGCAR